MRDKFSIKSDNFGLHNQEIFSNIPKPIFQLSSKPNNDINNSFEAEPENEAEALKEV